MRLHPSIIAWWNCRVLGRPPKYVMFNNWSSYKTYPCRTLGYWPSGLRVASLSRGREGPLMHFNAVAWHIRPIWTFGALMAEIRKCKAYNRNTLVYPLDGTDTKKTEQQEKRERACLLPH